MYDAFDIAVLFWLAIFGTLIVAPALFGLGLVYINLFYRLRAYAYERYVAMMVRRIQDDKDSD